jgi:folate-binding protein YgfZ
MPQRSPLHEAASAARAVFREEAGWLMPAHYGDVSAEYRQARQQAALFDVSHHGRVVLSGPDARSFLHNLCTNDVKHLRTGEGIEAFLSTHKARAVAYLRVWSLQRMNGKAAEELWLDVGPGMSEPVVRHLDHYLVSEQVEIRDGSSEVAQLHLAGPAAATIVAALPADASASPVRMVPSLDPLGLPGYEIFCPCATAAPIWKQLRARGAVPAGLDAYELLRVEAGTPRFGIDLDEDRFVVEVNRGPRAISYTKGCYLGQEPIVMARDRGHVNRWLMGLKLSGGDAPPRGSKVFRGEQEVGQVTSAVVSPRLGSIALAYLRRGSDAPGTAVEVEQAGARVAAEVASLPFSA